MEAPALTGWVSGGKNSRADQRRDRDAGTTCRPYNPELVTTRRKWNELEPRTRRLIVNASVLEGVLKLAALIDLARRPSSEVRGSKKRWAAAVSLINAFGAVPIAYFAWGRRK